MARTNVLTNMSWLTVGPLLRLLIGIPLTGFTAHHLGLDGYGALTLAFSFTVMFSVLANLGLNDVLARTVAQRPAEFESLWVSVVTFKAILFLGYVAVVTSAAWALGYSSTLLWLVLLLSAMQGSISLDNSARAVFLGRQQAWILGMIDIGKVLVETTLTITVLLLGYGALMLAGVRLTTAVCLIPLTLLALLRYLRLHFRPPRLQTVRSLLPAGVRFASVSAIQGIYDRLGIVLLGHLLGAQAVALVGAATVLTEKLYWFIPSVQNALFPVFSSLHALARERLGPVFLRAFRYQTVLAVGCGLGLSVLGPWVIALLFPRQFGLAGSLLTILGWVCVPRLIGSFFITVLQSSGKERQVSWIAAIQCGVYLSTVVLFIQLWGLNGFAWAYLAAETTAVTLQASVLTHLGLLTQRDILSALLTVGSGCAVFCLTVYLPAGREHFFSVLGVLLCYPVLLLVTRRISGDDVRYLQSVWASGKPLTA